MKKHIVLAALVLAAVLVLAGSPAGSDPGLEQRVLELEQCVYEGELERNHMDCMAKLEIMRLMQKLHSDTFDAHLVDSLAEVCEFVVR